MSMNYFKVTGAWFIDLTLHLMRLGFTHGECPSIKVCGLVQHFLNLIGDITGIKPYWDDSLIFRWGNSPGFEAFVIASP
jgi:hypothetical protein